MRHRWSAGKFAGLGLSLGFVLAQRAQADLSITGGFGSSVSVGFVNSPAVSVAFGAAESVFQMDGFLRVPGPDLDDGVNLNRQLDNGDPNFLACAFGYSQPSTHQLLLNYEFAGLLHLGKEVVDG